MADPEAAKSKVENGGGKTGWEAVAAQDFKGETNINSETGEQRTFTLEDNYPLLEGETEEHWKERLNKIQTAIDKAEAEGAAADEKKAYESSKFGQIEAAAKEKLDQTMAKVESMDDKYQDFLIKRTEEGKISQEEASELLDAYLGQPEKKSQREKKIQQAQGEYEATVAGARQDYEDSKAVGTPEEQERYRQFFEERKEENYQNIKRTGRLTNQEQYYTSKAADVQEVKPVELSESEKVGIAAYVSDPKMRRDRAKLEEAKARAIKRLGMEKEIAAKSGYPDTEAKSIAMLEYEIGEYDKWLNELDKGKKKPVEVKPEDVAQTVEDLEGEKAQAEKKAEAEKAEQAEKAEDKKAEKTVDKKAEQKEEEPNYSMKEILEKGKDIVPSYMVEYWGKACEKYSLEEMRGITTTLENLKNGDREAAMKEVRGKWIEDGFVMGAIAMFDPAGIKLIREALTEEYGAPNDHNKEYLTRYEHYHERKQKELAKAGEKRSTETSEKEPAGAGEKKSGMSHIEAEPFVQQNWLEVTAGAAKKIQEAGNKVEAASVAKQLAMAKNFIEAVNSGNNPSDDAIKDLCERNNAQALRCILQCSGDATDVLIDYHKRNNFPDDVIKKLNVWRLDFDKRKEAYEKKKSGDKTELKPKMEASDSVSPVEDYFSQFEVDPNDPYYVEGVSDFVNQQIQSIVARFDSLSKNDRKNEQESFELIKKALEAQAEKGRVPEKLLKKLNNMRPSLMRNILRGHSVTYEKHPENADKVAAELDFALTKYYQEHGYQQGRRAA